MKLIRRILCAIGIHRIADVGRYWSGDSEEVVIPTCRDCGKEWSPVVSAPDYQEYDAFDFDDDDFDGVSGDEALDYAYGECGMMGNGYCSMAGTEFCDWSCAIANPHRLKDVKEHLELNGGGRG